MAYTQISDEAEQIGVSPDVDHEYLMKEYTLKEAGFVYVYVSNNSPVNVYFDDVTISHTPTNVIQYNEYYPFGLQTENSWTRADNRNNFLYNGGSELNQNTAWYETFFRGYDAALGRFSQVDPLATASMQVSPYAFAFNDPVFYNDPAGAYPENTYVPTFWDPMAQGAGSGGDAVFEPLYPTFGPLQFGQHFIGYGSGNHWADGMQYSDWSAHGGSQMFRNAMASGARLLGGTQYVMDGQGEYQALSSRGGQLGHWEMNVNMVPDAYSSDGLAVATEMVFHQMECRTCPGSNYIAGLSPGFTIDSSSDFRDISDHTNYPGVNIYEHPDMSGGITLPGIGIIIGSDYTGRFRTRLLQHEYGHFLDSQWGWVTPNSPSSAANFYITVGISSLFTATISRLGIGDHGSSWTEVRANDWAKTWFGNRLDPDFEKFYPTSTSLSNE